MVLGLVFYIAGLALGLVPVKLALESGGGGFVLAGAVFSAALGVALLVLVRLAAERNDNAYISLLRFVCLSLGTVFLPTALAALKWFEWPMFGNL